MKRILVPTDFSKTAGNALTFALEIARRTGASVHVAHFTRPYEGIENNIYNALLIDEYLDQKRRGLANWLKKYTRNGAFEEVVVTSGVDLGMAASSIVEAAQKGHFDLICMGTTGASGLLGMLLGSVAGGVIGSSRVPVLVVPKNGSFRKLATVGMATDFRADLNQRSLDMLRQLLLIERAEFHVVHVFDKKEGKPDKEAEARLRQGLGGIAPKFHYLHDKNLTAAIHDFARSVDAHLLCAVSHRHSLAHRLFFASTSRQLAERARMPLLVLYD